MRRRLVATVIVAATLGVAGGAYRLATFTSKFCACDAVDEVSMPGHEHFSPDYTTARARFLRVAAEAGAQLSSFECPTRGPSGEAIYTDVARLGPDGAPRVLVVSSGTHGVEGFAGSAIQLGLLADGLASALPEDVRVVLIHAINPYGFAHLRRVNEDNVDLNRNFRDHSTPPPRNEPYEKLADVIAPRSFGPLSEMWSWGRILAFDRLVGRRAMQSAVSDGQYSHPDGLFYGGTNDTWSNRTLRRITAEHLASAARVVVVDVHTGLGAHGSLEILLNLPPGSGAVRRAITIWGDEKVRTTKAAGAVSIDLDASVKNAFHRMLGERVTAVSAEFGTVPLMDVFRALRAENWLHHHGGPEHRRARELRACLVRAFRPSSREWDEAVWTQGRAIILAALDHLGRPPE